MHSDYPIKETVKVLTVTKQQQKINFQIRHPENVFAIIGIAITCDKISDQADPGVPDFVNKGSMAGFLSLAIPQKGDVVFSDDVQIDNNEYADLVEKAVWGLALDISGAKKRDYYLKTFIKIDKAVLEGFYEDTYSPSITSNTGELLSYLYKIRIYVRYQMTSDYKITEKP
jgi:hypothetical protein